MDPTIASLEISLRWKASDSFWNLFPTIWQCKCLNRHYFLVARWNSHLSSVFGRWDILWKEKVIKVPEYRSWHCAGQLIQPRCRTVNVYTSQCLIAHDFWWPLREKKGFSSPVATYQVPGDRLISSSKKKKTTAGTAATVKVTIWLSLHETASMLFHVSS